VAPDRFAGALNEQIAREFSASQQYVAIAAYYEGEALPQLAALFYRQAVEERNHAMMMVQYLIDADLALTIPGVSAPRTEFPDAVAPVALALEQERKVTEDISGLAALARQEGDYMAEQFLQWFLKEQLEEISSMSDLLKVVQRGAASNLLLVEEHLARMPREEADDGTAPAAAGGAL
jgi:ferritin